MKKGLNKRGQATPGGETKKSLLSKLFGTTPKDGSDASKSKIGIGMVLFILFLLIFAPVAYFAGPQLWENTLKVPTQDAINWVMEKPKEAYVALIGEATDIGTGWNSKSNSSSSERGYVMDDLELLTSSPAKAGDDIVLKFDVDFENVGNEDVEANFYCNLMTKDKSEIISTGDILLNNKDTSNPVNLKTGSYISCKIPGHMTEELNDNYVIVGWFDYSFETNDVWKNVYFVPGDVVDSLDEQDKDFFDAFDIEDEHLYTVYNGEPVMLRVSMGDDEFVVVRESVMSSILELQIEDQWGGEVKEMLSMKLSLPQGVTINSLGTEYCPFQPSGSELRSETYRLDSAVLADLLTEDFFLGEDLQQKTFTCWVDLDDDLVSDNYKVGEVHVDASYIYQTAEKSVGLDIKGEEEAPRVV
tara:strand:- start:607 stop:1851 length:1245 start_codon:yes stop_codon:yes gene_type:complete